MLVRISAEEAVNILLNENIKTKTATKHIVQSLGYIINEDIISNINIPIFNKSAFDGYALKSEDIRYATKEHPVVLEVIDYIPAGKVSKLKIEKGQAMRIMTGAKVPEGADLIIKYEDTEFTSNSVKIFNPLQANSNIIPIGEDVACGDIIIRKGTKIEPSHIGLLASIGIDKVNIIDKVKVAIIATGSELVDISDKIEDGKIVNSNSYTLAAQIKSIGAEPLVLRICKDSIDDIKLMLMEALEVADIIITTGGVSVGDEDFVKDSFFQIGANILFNKINMKPGGAMISAKINDKYLFGLSGNPAAANISFDKIVRPFILKSMGINPTRKKVSGILTSDIFKESKQNRYIKVRAYYKEEKIYIDLPGKFSSSVLSPLCKTNAILCISIGQKLPVSGSKVEVELIDSLEVV